MYDTSGRVANYYEYGHDMYANAIDFFCQIQRHVEKIFSMY